MYVNCSRWEMEIGRWGKVDGRWGMGAGLREMGEVELFAVMDKKLRRSTSWL